MTRTQHRRARSPGLLGPSAVMAAGTVVSRLTGFGRAAMISAALGLAVTADVFNVANVLPNMLYILVGGGVLNSVLVPALVRAIKNDADGGQAYSQRLYSVLITVLGIATVVSILAAPALMRLVVDPSYLEPDMRPFFDNMVVIARFCLPQIFFYGLYVLIGQMLNAKGRFGPMMWAPILNNAVAIVVFALFIVVYGTKSGDVLTTGEMALIGLGSTLGVVAQALCLIPVLRTTGFSLRFRTDWKGHGLSEPVKLGLWTFGFVAVNQVAYLFFVRVATGASAIAADGTSAAGYTVYSNAMLIMMVPHSVITVSLATALLPRLSELAAEGDLDEVRKKVSSALRMCLAIIIPIGALMAALAFPLAALIFNYGAAAGQTGTVAATLVALLPGLVGFTVHYLSLRGFYALQDTKTPFFTQVWVAGAMVVWAIGMQLFAPDASVVTVVLGIGYSVAYVVGASVSLIRLQHHIGGSLHVGSLVGHVGKVGVPAALAAGIAYLTSVGWSQLGLEDILPNILAQTLELAICGSVGVAVYVGLAYAFGIREVRMGIALFAAKVLRREVTVPDGESALEPAEDLHEAHTGTLSIFRRPALDPEMTAEFFLDETLPGVPGFWDTAAITSVAAAQAPPIRPSMGAGRTGVDDRALTLDIDTQPDLVLDARRAVTTDTARPHHTLAGRFQLEELLDDSGGVRSWRALDLVLRRPVFLQSVSAADPRAHAFAAAARRASTVADPRFLRVLDVGIDDVAYLVREWTPGRSLLDLLSDGAFHPAHAAAISREVADALTGAHAQGLSHRRLDPRLIFITADGGLKIAGLETEAALRGITDVATEHTARYGHEPAVLDAAGVGAVLYAGLTARWPADTNYGLERAPSIDGRLASPRQVRPRVPRSLDQIADRAIGYAARHHTTPLLSPAAVAMELDAGSPSRPVFGDGEEAPGGPPALLDEPERPLPDGRAVPVRSVARRRRKSSRLARVLGVGGGALLLVGATLIGLQLLLGAIENTNPGDLQQTPSNPAATQGTAPSTEPVAIDISDATDFDPVGDGEENSDDVGLVIDGDPETAWRTVNYFDPLEDQKDGVGIYLDLGVPTSVSTLRLALVSPGADLEIRVAPESGQDAPGSLDDWTLVSEFDSTESAFEATFDEAVTTRYVLVWFTRLPPDSGNYRGGIAEAEVLG